MMSAQLFLTANIHQQANGLRHCKGLIIKNKNPVIKLMTGFLFCRTLLLRGFFFFLATFHAKTGGGFSAGNCGAFSG